MISCRRSTLSGHLARVRVGNIGPCLGKVAFVPRWKEKLGELFNGNPKRRRQLMVIAGVSFLLVALLEAAAPEWAAVLVDLVLLIVSVV